jgi:hypothetical protein
VYREHIGFSTGAIWIVTSMKRSEPTYLSALPVRRIEERVRRNDIRHLEEGRAQEQSSSPTSTRSSAFVDGGSGPLGTERGPTGALALNESLTGANTLLSD